MTAHDVYKRKRIKSNTEGRSTDDWFRYDRKYLFGLGDIYKKISKEVLLKFDIAEEYWKNGELN